MNTNLHVSRAQAESLLAAVEFETNSRLADMLLNDRAWRERLNELAANKTMLYAALSRLDDLEAKRAPHLRVASVGGPGVRDGLYSADWLST